MTTRKLLGLPRTQAEYLEDPETCPLCHQEIDFLDQDTRVQSCGAVTCVHHKCGSCHASWHVTVEVPRDVMVTECKDHDEAGVEAPLWTGRDCDYCDSWHNIPLMPKAYHRLRRESD